MSLKHSEGTVIFKSSRSFLVRCETYERLANDLAEEILAVSKKAITENGHFSVALSGGATPKGLYLKMSDASFRNRFDWHRIHFFWGDERWVSPDHLRSNYRMAAEALLTKVDIPIENIHPIATMKNDPDESASLYEEELAKHFGTRKGEFPRFDFLLLGLGQDGHTASLFPGNAALDEKKRFVIPVFEKDLEEPRITLTLPVMNRARHIVFIVSGMEKADILKRVLESKSKDDLLPAQRVRPERGNLFWFVDKSAASHLSEN